MIALTKITTSEIFALIVALVFRLLSCKVCLKTGKTIETIKK